MTIRDTPTAQVNSPQAILLLLHEQAVLYGQLETLAERQRRLVTSEDVGPLFGVLADRQKLSDQLARIGQQLTPIRDSWTTVRNRFTPIERHDADRLWGEARDRLRRVIESDERDARILSGRKAVVATSLRRASATGQAMSAYRAPANTARRLDFVDERGP